MDFNADDLIAGLLAENKKLEQFEGMIGSARAAMADGAEQLHKAKEKLAQDEFNEALSSAKRAVEQYQQLISHAQQVKIAENSSSDVEQWKKEASDLLHTGEIALAEAKQIEFAANDLQQLQMNIELEIAAENWILVDQYSGDALQSYPDNGLFAQYAAQAKQKLAAKTPPKIKKFTLPFRR